MPLRNQQGLPWLEKLRTGRRFRQSRLLLAQPKAAEESIAGVLVGDSTWQPQWKQHWKNNWKDAVPPKVSLGDESFHWLRATASPLLIAKLLQAEVDRTGRRDAEAG